MKNILMMKERFTSDLPRNADALQPPGTECLDPFNLGSGEIVYHGCDDDRAHASPDDPRGVLVPGQAYRVVGLHVGDWNSFVRLDGVRGKFNTSCFHLKETQ